MMEFVRQKAVLLAAVIILWYTASSLMATPEAKADERKKLEAIGPRYLGIRPEGHLIDWLADPYRFDNSPPGAQEGSTPGAPPADEGEMPPSLPSLAPSGTGAARAAGPAGLGPGVVGDRRESAATALPAWLAEAAAAAAPPAELPLPEEPVTLWVDAVVVLPGGGSARLCGETLAVGDELPQVDAEHPPRLLAVVGDGVRLLYRGREYTLSVDDEPLVLVAPPASEPEVDP